MPASDQQGRVALMLCESILHVLVEENVITKEKALDAINTVADLTREMARGNPTAKSPHCGGSHSFDHRELRAEGLAFINRLIRLVGAAFEPPPIF